MTTFQQVPSPDSKCEQVLCDNCSVFPHSLKPMPTKRQHEAFTHPDWVFEIKHDGFRALAFVQDGACRLASRNGNTFSSLATLTAALPGELKAKSAVLDGEIVCLDGDVGRTKHS